MKRFWISWNQPTVDYRSVNFPPGKDILGWWCTGSGDDYWTLVAWVKAASVEDARMAVLVEWPEASVWRFGEEVSIGWRPGDRFPMAQWMIERITDGS